MVSSTTVTTSHVDPTDPSKHLKGQQSFHIHVGTVQLKMSRTTIGIPITSVSYSSKMLNRSLTDINTITTQRESSTRSHSMVRQSKFNNKDQKLIKSMKTSINTEDQLKWTKDRQQKTIEASVQYKTYQDQSGRVRSTKPLQSSKK